MDKGKTKLKWCCCLKIKASVPYSLKLFKHMEMYVKSIYYYVIFLRQNQRVSVLTKWHALPFPICSKHI